MIARLALSAFVLIASACASPADMAKADLGSGKCADQAEERCENDLAGSDRLACLKREIYLCEELEKANAP